MEENKIKTNNNGKENRPRKNGGKNRNKGYNNQKKKGEKRSEYIPMYPEEVLAIKVKDLKLSPGLTKVLLEGGIDTINKIARRTAREMYQVKFFNKKHFIELSKALNNLGVDFKPDEKIPHTDVKPAEIPKIDATPNETKNERKQESEKNREKKEKFNKQPMADISPKKQKPQKNVETEQKELPQKGKKQDNSFDVYRIFPRAPFRPTPPIEAKKDHYIKFQRGGKWGFKNKQGKEIIPPIYDEVFSFKEDIACVERKQMFGFINRANELIIPYKYECASSFSEGLACVCLNDKCGYINAKDEIVIPFIYDAGTAFSDGTARVKQNGRWGTYYLETNEVDWAN